MSENIMQMATSPGRRAAGRTGRKAVEAAATGKKAAEDFAGKSPEVGSFRKITFLADFPREAHPEMPVITQ